MKIQDWRFFSSEKWKIWEVRRQITSYVHKTYGNFLSSLGTHTAVQGKQICWPNIIFYPKHFFIVNIPSENFDFLWETHFISGWPDPILLHQSFHTIVKFLKIFRRVNSLGSLTFSRLGNSNKLKLLELQNFDA